MIRDDHVAVAASEIVTYIGKHLTPQQEALCRIIAQVVARVPGMANTITQKQDHAKRHIRDARSIR